ncbi:MAG TPA: pyridoxal-phosphate dependent enzyme [Candidatus Paceibacterota bacterium]|nr:pyridoxal-phosphate dependent enzyme [Candidatus Paceibacterota bacterium]
MYGDLRDRIGNTPIVPVGQFGELEIRAKLESNNPGGAVKDRAALFILEKMKREGLLDGNDKVLLAPSSGSFAGAAAWLGPLFGHRALVVVHGGAPKARIEWIRGYGAEVKQLEQGTVTGDCFRYCEQLVAEHPDRYLLLDQLNDWAAVDAHEQGTGPEIIRAMPDVAHIFASSGSGATICGIVRHLIQIGHPAQVWASEGIFEDDKKITGTHVEGKDFHSRFLDEWLQSGRVNAVPVWYREALHGMLLLNHAHNVPSGIQGGGVFFAALKNVQSGISGKAVMVLGDGPEWYAQLLQTT